MANVRHSTLWCLPALLSLMGSGAINAQTRAALNPTPIAGPTPVAGPAMKVVTRRVFVPGSGWRTLRLAVLPSSAIHAGLPSQDAHARLGGPDPILYGSSSDYTSVGDPSNFQKRPDPLWTFPTLGYDLAKAGAFYQVANSLDFGATADVALGQTGTPAHITQLVIAGQLADPSGVGKVGDIFILLFKGVGLNIAKDSQGNPIDVAPSYATPTPNNAQLQFGDSLGALDGYDVAFGSGNQSQFWTIDCSANPYVLDDPNGRFGLMVAKSDGDANVSWYGLVNSPNGPNTVFQVTGGDFTTVSKRFYPSGTDYNQGAAGVGVYNYFFELHGKSLTNTALGRGTLQGYLHRRGVSPPFLPNLEAGPGCYLVTAYSPGTSTVVRQDYLFTQPSYSNSTVNGHAVYNTGQNGTSPNYKLEGYPVGTYSIEVRAIPILASNGTTDTRWPNPLSYPYSDFVPKTSTVTISANAVTTLNVRLERLGDIARPGSLVPDGVVNAYDLSYLISSFGKITGQAGFLPQADLVGLHGAPDGVVNARDLSALILEYGLGSIEKTEDP